MSYEIHTLFVFKTFVKPSKPDSMLELPGYTRYIEEIVLDKRKGVELLRMLVIT